MSAPLIAIKVTAGARTEGVELQADGSLKVRVRVKAEKGRANERLLELLAEHFGVSKSQVALERGATSKTKLIRLATP